MSRHHQHACLRSLQELQINYRGNTAKCVPSVTACEMFGHHAGQLKCSVHVLQVEVHVLVLEHPETPIQMHPMCSRNVSHGWGSFLLNDLYDSFIIFTYSKMNFTSIVVGQRTFLNLSRRQIPPAMMPREVKKESERLVRVAGFPDNAPGRPEQQQSSV